jgi:prephenate dehydrogenase
MKTVIQSFQRVAIIGLGLIGGSICRALRRAHPQIELIGFDKKPALDQARDADDILDHAFAVEDAYEGLRHVDLVFLATPIDSIISLLPKIAERIGVNTLVTDVGSTKTEIVKTARAAFTSRGYFIGGHPMAGKAHSGWQHAEASLFENAVYVLTPVSETPEKLRTDFHALLQSLGAQVIEMDAEAHDRVVAAVSHLPQLLAVALMNYVSKDDVDRTWRFRLAANGFRDMTRIASSPFPIWQDILRTNKPAIRQTLREFRECLSELESLDETEAIETMFNEANWARQQLPQNGNGAIAQECSKLLNNTVKGNS